MYALPYIVFQRLHQAAIAARRRDRTWRYLLYSAFAGLLAGGMLGIGGLFAWMLWHVGLYPLAVVIVVVMLAPVAGNLLVRHAFAPLGWVRAAYYAGVASRPGADAQAYALCCAAWAFAHRPTGTRESWLARRRELRVPLGDAEVVVTALLAAGRGDADTARALLRSVELLVETHPEVRELAGEWLAVDAAERGAWVELADDAAAARWPASPLTYFLEGVAAHRTGAAGAPARGDLVARWLLAPYRRVTRLLLAVDRAPPARHAPLPVEAIDVVAPGASEPPAPLPRAIAAHLAFTTTVPSASSLALTVRAWDAALADAATHGWLARRALELDAPLGAVDRALREVTTTVTDELGRAADAAHLGAPASQGSVGDALVRRLRHGRLDALEAGFARWAQRRHDGTVHPAIDEWREFVALRAAYDAAVRAGGLELRRLAFPHAFSTGSNMAAWLWNTRNEYALSHAISKWLLGEALAVGDAEAIELGHRNCRLTVPTRLGDVSEA